MCPRLLTIYGPIAIQSYGFMIVVGLLVFLGITYFHPRRIKLMPGDVYLNAVFMALLVGVLGGRILGVIADWPSFRLNPIEVFYPWVGGFVVLGAIVAIVTIMPLYLWWYRVPILASLDFAAVYAPLLQAIARFGCLFAGCCYGAQAASSFWWTMTFTNPEAHMPPHLLGIPLLPTQLYAAALSAAIFVVMLLLQRYFTRLGQALFFYLMSENVARFTVDFWRGDRGLLQPFFGYQFSQFQIYSLFFLVVCVFIFLVISFFGQKVSNK
jgi:phosphatidylglycerol---prolipoprotein diacylglyceryl transferase